MQSIEITRLTFTSLFKVIFIGLGCFMVPLFILFGVLAAFDMQVLYWNGQPLSGIPALIASPFMGLFSALFFSILMTLWIWIGQLISSRFYSFTIHYLPKE